MTKATWARTRLEANAQKAIRCRTKANATSFLPDETSKAGKEAMAMKRTTRDDDGLRAPRKQREVIRDVMLSAGQCATWLTLDELSKLTQYPPASISAQLRHLRKPEHGAFAVVKRSRAMDKTMRAEGFGVLWEYSVEEVRRVYARRKRKAPRRPRKAKAAEELARC
jgi:hypothetical protein